MTDQATAATGFRSNAEFLPHARKGAPGVSGRLAEVAIWLWRIAAVGFAAWVMIAAAVLYVLYGREEEVFGILGLYAAGAVVLTAAVWAARYVATGQKRAFGKMLKETAFGNLDLYFWFVPAVLYFGSLGMAMWHGANYNDLRMQHLAEGFGSALFVLILGAPGWFFAPRDYSHVGHMIGTVVAAILTVAATVSAASL